MGDDDYCEMRDILENLCNKDYRQRHSAGTILRVLHGEEALGTGEDAAQLQKGRAALWKERSGLWKSNWMGDRHGDTCEAPIIGQPGARGGDPIELS